MSDTKQDLTPAELAELLREGAVTLVDVREPAEFAAEHIEGAVPRPLSGFDPASLPPGRLVLQCGIGKRSLMALQKCRDAGTPHRQHLQGGLAAWKQAGFPTVRA